MIYSGSKWCWRWSWCTFSCAQRNSIFHNNLQFTLENRRCSAFEYSSRRHYFLGTQDSDDQPLQRKGHSFLFQMPYSTAPSLSQMTLCLIISTTRYSNSTIPQNVKLLRATRGTQHKITTFEKMLSYRPGPREFMWLFSTKAGNTKAIFTISMRMV